MPPADTAKLIELLNGYLADNSRFVELLAASARMGEQISAIQKSVERIESSHVTDKEATEMRSRITRLERIIGGFVLMIVAAVLTVWIRTAVPDALVPPGIVSP